MKTKRKSTLRYLLAAVVVIGAAVAVKLLFFTSDAAPAPAATEAVRGDIESTVLATGTLEAFRLVSVGAQVSGQLESLKVELGDKVKQGDLLAEIDSTTQQNTIRNAEAQLLTAEAQRQAQAAALKQAQLTYQRQKELLAIDATSRQEFEAAEASLSTIRAQIAASDAGIAQSKVALDTARVNLGYTQIRAPMDGTVVALIAQEGQTLNANQTTPTILKLAQLDKLTVKAQISEGDVVRVKPGQQVYFTILGEPDKRYYATLRSVEPAPDSIATESSGNSVSSSSSSSSSAVYYNGLFDIDNPDGTLRISMTAQVHIVLDSAKDAVLVPSTAIRPGPEGKGGGMVRVLTADGKTEPRRVQIGIDNNIMAQVLSGLEPGERVVTGSGGGLAAAAGQGNRPRVPGGAGMMRMR